MGSLAPVAIAVIGAGKIGTQHLSLVAQSPDASLVCIVDPTLAGKDLADFYRVPHQPDVEYMFQSGVRLDAAIICTPNNTHVAIGKRLATRGVHLLMEKPFSTSFSEGRDLLSECRRQGIHVVVGHHRRHNSFIRAAREILHCGSIGKILGVSGIWASLKPTSYFAGLGEWHTGPDAGVVLINLIHEVDLLQMLIGPITRVYAEQAQSTRHHEAEEGVAVTLRFEDGVVGTFLALDNAPSPHNIEAGTGENPSFPFSGRDCYRIFGQRGTLSVPDNTLSIPHSLENGWNSKLAQTGFIPEHIEDAYERQLNNFIAVLRGQQAPICSGEAGLSAVAVCEAIRKSLKCRLPVDVELIEA